MHRVIVLDSLPKNGLDLLKASANIDYEIHTGLKGQELRAMLNRFDGAICRGGVKITAKSLEGNKRLKAIVQADVATDNIDLRAATRAGIVVMNTPSGNAVSTAEHAIALMLALSRNLAPAHAALLEGRWEREKFVGTQLAGKTLGIVGLGSVGQAVAVRAHALDMKLLGYDPFLSAARAKELGIEVHDSARSMFPLVDYLTVHVALTDETRGLVNAESIKLMKPGVRLINCARGGIFDEAALVEGLVDGHLAGVALDVFEHEPCTASPLFGMPGVLCTPRLGASTEEARENVAIEAVELLIDYLTTGTIRQAVNASPLDAKTLESLREYLNVAWRLGLLLAQVDPAPPNRCRLVYRGEAAKKDTRLLSAAFAAGLLRHAIDAEVNVVNTPWLLEERGIELVEERTTDLGNFNSMITAEVISGEKTSMASGTLFGNNMPRLVQKSDCDLESYLDGDLVILQHHDAPGMIGRVGSIFGRHRVNIAQMSLGRKTRKPGGEAVAILSLDTSPPEEAIAEVLAVGGVNKAWTIHLPPAREMPTWMGGEA
ncbi:MAG: phosphoglycerate dehydrogenase [Pirellulaceae bacterium]|nr:phosphoglycerate dehydrogenase [Pirellulaceae bacterium]